MTHLDKRTALEVRPAEFENRLFFAARNLAIEALLLRIETTMLRQGFDVAAEWRESSRGGPVLSMRLKNAKTRASAGPDDYAEASVWIARDTIRVLERRSISECYYRVDSVNPPEYAPHRESKHVLAYRELVRQLGADGYFASEVAKVNYPFDYHPHSSF